MTNSTAKGIEIIQTLVIDGIVIRSTGGVAKEKKVGKGKNKSTYVKIVESPTNFTCTGAETNYVFIKNNAELRVKKDKKGYRIIGN